MEDQIEKRKKVLIITYYWPPAGGPGVQRVLKFVKYLPQFGWEPIVLTVANGEYPAIDHSLEKDIPERIKVYKTRTIEPFSIFKKLTGKTKEAKLDTYLISKKSGGFFEKISIWLRLNLFIPDARVGWMYYSLKDGKRIIKKEGVSLILTSSPPHSVQLIGLLLSKKTKIPWVADFRDPWAEIVYYQNVKRNIISKKVDGFLEKRVLKKATKIITISNEIKNIFNSKFKREGIEVLPNGFDDTIFSQTNKPEKIGKKISIVYTGVLSEERNPEFLIEAFSKLPVEKKNKIEFIFFGTTSLKTLEKIKSKKLSQFFRIEGYKPYLEIVEILKKATCLLLVIDKVPNNMGFLTGKLFDYLGARKPILAIGPTGGDAEKIIHETNSGWFLDYGDEEGFSMVLKSLIQGDYNFSFQVENYSRINQVKSLSNFLNQVSGTQN